MATFRHGAPNPARHRLRARMSALITLAIAVALLFHYRPDLKDALLGGLAARIVVVIDKGTVTVKRGRLPGSVLEDLRFVAEDDPTLKGRVHLNGRGPGLRIQVRGLPEGPAQRVRNVINLRRRDV